MSASHPWQFARKWALVLIAVLGFIDAGHAQVLQDQSPAVKAAYLLQIPRYCFWPDEKRKYLEPEDGEGELHVVTVGEAPSCRALKALESKADRLPLRLRVRTRSSAAHLTREDVQWAHVVYAPQQDECLAIHLAYPAASVLLVTDGLGGTRSGAAVAFYLSENKVRLELAPYQASTRGIQFSARLLKVAGIVRRDGEQARR